MGGWWFCDIVFIVDDVVVLVLVSVCWLFFVIGVCVCGNFKYFLFVRLC